MRPLYFRCLAFLEGALDAFEPASSEAAPGPESLLAFEESLGSFFSFEESLESFLSFEESPAESPFGSAPPSLFAPPPASFAFEELSPSFSFEELSPSLSFEALSSSFPPGFP